MTRARKPFTLIAATLFLVAAAVHLFRLYSGFQVIVGSHVIPQAASWIFVVVAGLLSAMLFAESRR